MREEIDPSKIEDEGLREVVRSLMNLVEELSTKVAQQAEEIQRLRDENNRLKGEQGKPKIKPNVKENPVISSEQERRVPKAHHKTRKHAHLSIDRVEVVKLDRQAMPADAQFKGYEDVIVQDLDIRMQTIKFRKEKYYSKSQKRTYLATLPEGYQGQFGPEVKAWVLTLYYADGMSEPKILDFLQTAGLSISAGQLSALLIKDQESFHREHADILQAGLGSSPFQHLDSTGTCVNGTQQQCHILCNPCYSAYQTTATKDRMSLLRVLEAGAEPIFQLNELACRLLVDLGVTEKWCRLLPTLLPSDRCYTEAQLDEVLRLHLPPYGDRLRKSVKEAMAIAHYRSQTTFPIVKLLVCDDAPQFTHLTDQLALCWVHEYRHDKKLIPRFLVHCHILEQFAKDFWTFYRELLVYREAPSQAEAERLRIAFETLFEPNRGYQQLDACLARTRSKKDKLLMVLSHPEILLHNNPAELGARQRVRKRDVSEASHAPEKVLPHGIPSRPSWRRLANWESISTSISMTASHGVGRCRAWLLSLSKEQLP